MQAASLCYFELQSSTSYSKSIPCWRFTRSRISSASAMVSAAVASSPSVTMKFACFSETTAPPRRVPFMPSSSIILPVPTGLEEAAGGTRAVRLRCHPLTLGLVHPRANLVVIVMLQAQRRTQEKLSFTKGCVAIVPLHFIAGNFDHPAGARDANCFDNCSNLLFIRSRVHPKRAAHSSGNSTQSFDPGQSLSRHLHA